MIVQIFEPGAEGHFTYYVGALLRALSPLLEARQLSRVVVTTSRNHRRFPAFQDQLSRYSSVVEFDASLEPIEHPLRASQAAATAVLDAAARIQPDYLILTAADHETVGLALLSALKRRSLPKRIHSVAVIHRGDAVSATPLDRIKDEVFRLSRQFSPWTDLRIVNPVIYEEMKRRQDRFSAPMNALPHPVEPLALCDKPVARTALGIPVDGRYIGYIGMIDERKALPELLSAFRAANLANTDRLLLAGQLYQPYQDLIERDYADLLRQDRIILINRYITHDEFSLGLCALDVAAPLYYPRLALSASLLQAAFLHRPVIADSYGYSGMIVDRFRLGWSCDVNEPGLLAATIRTALEKSADFRFGEGLARLIEFHDPKNYTDSVLGALYQRVGLPAPAVKTWEWATALPEGARPR